MARGRCGGFRRKTRSKLRQKHGLKGKINIQRYFQKFNIGDKVYLAVNPAIHRGMYFPRFHGKVGIIKDQKGKCYEVKIKDQNKEKILIIHPIHLRRV